MLRQLVDLGVKVKLPVSVLYDNQSAIDLSKNPVQHSRSKHIDIQYHFIKDQVEEGTIQLEYVGTKDQISNILTKPLSTKLFEKHRMSLSVQMPPQAGSSGESSISTLRVFQICNWLPKRERSSSVKGAVKEGGVHI